MSPSAAGQALAGRLLDVIERDIIPPTQAGVAAGNKIFGAAVLRRDDLAVVVAEVNQETGNPLLHGEISCINAYWRLPADSRPAPADCLFLSTHEPCPLCLSAIAWSGFPGFYYFFSYADSRDEFAIPHDLKMLEEIFGCPDGGYRRSNAFWTAHDLQELAAGAGELLAGQVTRIRQAYARLSAQYQRHKGDSEIPLK